jgi:hypothetical protein
MNELVRLPESAAAPSALTRRAFLGGCAACAARGVCSAQPAPQQAGEKTRVRLVFSHRLDGKPTWPNIGYDYEARKKDLASRLAAACPNIEFLTATAGSVDDAKRVLERDSEVDGYAVYMVGIFSGAGRTIAETNRPTLMIDDLYAGSGEFLTAYAACKRKGLRVAGVSSSRFEDVADAMKTFDAIKRLRSAVIIDVTERDPGRNAISITETMGTSVRKVTAEEYNDAYQKADPGAGREWAQRWMKGAKKVVEPSKEEIEKSGRMYMALLDLMKRYKSDAVTVDCLTLFYGGKAPAYPCLGFFQLNNDGKVGACEGDLQSTSTMLAMTYLTGLPGYISDPVIDTSKNQIIYAHCVAPSKVHGVNGPAAQYHIRDHSEDRKGASVRVLMPLNEITTSLKFNPVTREVIVHQARAVANIDEDKACRTKLAAEVKDPVKLLSEWDKWGWHRVTFYGDLRRPLETLSGLLGYRVVEEG